MVAQMMAQILGTERNQLSLQHSLLPSQDIACVLHSYGAITQLHPGTEHNSEWELSARWSEVN